MLTAKLINQTSKEVDKTAETRIRLVINDSGQQIQIIAPQIIQQAIEDVYKTPFRLLGGFGKQKLSQTKKKISKLIKKWLRDKYRTKFITVVLPGIQMEKGN